MRPISEWLPPAIRRRVYELLATLYLLELIFDVVPAGWQDRIVAALAVLGFSLARVNTTNPPPPSP